MVNGAQGEATEQQRQRTTLAVPLPRHTLPPITTLAPLPLLTTSLSTPDILLLVCAVMSWPGLLDAYLGYVTREVVELGKAVDATGLRVLKRVFTQADNAERCGEHGGLEPAASNMAAVAVPVAVAVH